MINLKSLLWRLSWKIRSWGAKGLQVGQTFPDFSLKDVNGRQHTLSQSNGAQYTLLWFTNLCDDCRSRIPLLWELVNETQEQLRILAVSLIGSNDPLNRKVAQSSAFPVLLDPDDVVGKQLGLPHPPETCPLHNLFILNQGGYILFRGHLSALSHEAFKKVWYGLLKR